MSESKNILVANYAAFIPNEMDKRVYSIVTNEAGEEIGIEIKGLLTTFGQVNDNGYNFDRQSYDKVVNDYFEANELNIPVDLMHVRDNVTHLAGVLRKFTKRNGGVEITAFIPKGVYFYGLIKVLLDNGVLQGFSNYGWITKGDWNNDEILVSEFRLISASLVDLPADVGGKFVANATQFEGFNEADKEAEALQQKLVRLKNELSIYGL